jgi:hypothetical protein
MPRLVGGDTEIICVKLKSCNRFLKPNFELGPNRSRHDSIDGLLVRHPHGDTGVKKRDQLDLLLSQGKLIRVY